MQAVHFYKAWDEYGALSNFSCHPIRLSQEPMTDASTSQNCTDTDDWREWRSVEHYYQAQKFASTSGMLLQSCMVGPVLLLTCACHCMTNVALSG